MTDTKANNYSELPSIPPLRRPRRQLGMANRRASMESLPASCSQITPGPSCHVSVLPEDEINEDNPDETPVHKEARYLNNKDKEDPALP